MSKDKHSKQLDCQLGASERATAVYKAVHEDCERDCNNAGDSIVKSVVEIFTDGACKGNPGRGGWGVLLRYDHHEKSLYGAEEHTTNNRMELTAAIQGLAALKRSCKIILTTDSEYVRKGITEWLPKWHKRNWKTADKKPIKNVDLWQELDKQTQRHDIEWRWVKGHSGHRENEIADQLANQAIDELLKK